MGLTCENCELYSNKIISYALFDNVQNCKELKEKSKTEEIKVALINPKLVRVDLISLNVKSTTFLYFTGGNALVCN